MNETLRAATPHAHATEMTRNGVACYSVMRVSAVVGGLAEAVYAYPWRILKRLGAKNTHASCPFEKVNSEQ